LCSTVSGSWPPPFWESAHTSLCGLSSRPDTRRFQSIQVSFHLREKEERRNVKRGEMETKSRKEEYKAGRAIQRTKVYERN
jgi:hypothetical protein